MLVCGIGPYEYNRIYACETSKEIYDRLKTTHEGITHVKESKVYMLEPQYENFSMKEGVTIHETYTYLLPSQKK